jgi:hypothetical protein
MTNVDKQKLCCRDFCKFLNDTNVPIDFREQDGEDDYYGNLFVFNWLIDSYPLFSPISCCPWCGKEFEQTFLLALQDILMDFDVKEADCANFSLETKIPEQFSYLKNRDWFEKQKEEEREMHRNNGFCSMLDYNLKEAKPIIYMPNTRTHGILRERNFKDGYWVEGNKAEYCDFEPVNYCCSCGAKFPERLDQKLTEILQKEYELESWKDYKQAPEEFQTDEWWKKRGL